MRQQKQQGHSALDEIAALKDKFNIIKSESEEFVARAKKLSDSGMHEAMDLLEAAKTNWHSMTNSFGDLSKLFSKSAKPAKKMASNVKKTTKKKAKAIKKVSRTQKK